MDADVLIIGSGQAGVPLATRLAGAGKKVILVERKELGGTCVNVGCTPTKTMVASARAAHVARTAARLGVHVREVRVDFPAVVDRKDAIVRRWRSGVEERLKKAGDRLVLVRGHARFVGQGRVEVGGEVHSAQTVIVNTGARGVEPPIDGLAGVPWLHNGTLLELRQLPAHLVVLGGGYIGCEFAQMFRRFGARVTIVDRAEHLLAREDADISAEVEKAFREEGIELRQPAKVARVEGKQGDIAVRLEGGGEVRGSHLLVAVGRRPNTDDLGCDQGGIELDDKGAIRVDDRYRTSAEGTYAVGDVTGGPQFTHTSWDDHRILFDILMGKGKRGRNGRLVPYTVFTDPQVAGVGITEREARKKGIKFEIASMDFGSIARALEVDEPRGRCKILLDPDSEHILGVFLCGAEAGELIHIFVPLMQAGAKATAIVDAEFVHPTFSEGMQSLVMRLERYALS
jgi:pyruvate/2-oxoglutarate dehydrogenase complex dihydrolipoamide dehydrogenase (E3) component